MTHKLSERICFSKDDLPSGSPESAASDKASTKANTENLDKTPVKNGKKRGLFVSSIIIAVLMLVVFVPFAMFASSLLPPILKGGAEDLGQGLGLIILVPLFLMYSAAVVAPLSIAGVVLSASGLCKEADGRTRIWFLCDLIVSALLLALTIAAVAALFIASAVNNAGNTTAIAPFFSALL